MCNPSSIRYRTEQRQHLFHFLFSERVTPFNGTIHFRVDKWHCTSTVIVPVLFITWYCASMGVLSVKTLKHYSPHIL